MYFILEGDFENLPDWEGLKDAVQNAVAESLKVDVSRVLDIVITVSGFFTVTTVP